MSTLKELTGIPLPGFVDPATWSAFVETRLAKGKRFPFTTYAAVLIILRLTKFKAAGFDPNQCLEQSIIKGYSGVFETPNKPPPPPIDGKPAVTVRNTFLADQNDHKAELARPEVAASAKAARLAAMAKLRPMRVQQEQLQRAEDQALQWEPDHAR